jgi:phosphatidate cytidylyltransferase
MGAIKQRVVTALMLIPLVVTAVLLLPTVGFGILFGLVLLPAAEEWSKLAGFSACGSYIGFLGAVVAAVLAATWMLYNGSGLLPLFSVAAIWWIWNALHIAWVREVPKRESADPTAYVTGLLVLVPAWTGLVWIHQLDRGPYLVLSLLILIWIADSSAYFAGRRWGRRKLAPAVSPGKTREGVYGALAGGLIWGVMLALWYAPTGGQGIGLALLCLVTVFASIVGDLYESLIKRERGLKDSGALLPGHGGILDRIDSLTAAAPVFALGLYFMVATA